MTTDETIRVLERMRELLADPSRVVLDPMHYFEVENGKVREATFEEAAKKHETCRVCFCGAATMAAFEVADDGQDEDLDEAVRGLLTKKTKALGIPLDAEVAERYVYHDEPVTVLTSALKQGRAVEVVDAVLADLRARARA